VLQHLSAEERAQVLEATPHTAHTDPSWVQAYASISAIESAQSDAIQRVAEAAEAVRSLEVDIQQAKEELTTQHEAIRETSELLLQRLERETERRKTINRRQIRSAARSAAREILSQRWLLVLASVVAGVGLCAVPATVAILTSGTPSP